MSGASQEVLRNAVLCIVNGERTARGLPAVKENPKLEAAAQKHSDDMVARNYFEHNTPEGKTPGDRIAAEGYAFSAWNENIAYGYRSPLEVMDGWMQSTGHCRDILAPNVTELGVGVNTGGAMWTQDFALPKGTDPPTSNTGPQDSCPAAGLLSDYKDTTPPQTKIGRSPAKRLFTRKRRRSVTIRFSASEAGASYTCRLDGQKAKACTSPVHYKLGTGKHTFTVFATDVSGNADRSAAKASFRIIRRN